MLPRLKEEETFGLKGLFELGRPPVDLSNVLGIGLPGLPFFNGELDSNLKKWTELQQQSGK